MSTGQTTIIHILSPTDAEYVHLADDNNKHSLTDRRGVRPPSRRQSAEAAHPGDPGVLPGRCGADQPGSRRVAAANRCRRAGDRGCGQTDVGGRDQHWEEA